MKYSRTLHNHHLQLLLGAVERDPLQGPVPVIIIILAEMFTASSDLVPHNPGETHPHVMLTTQPVIHISLVQTNFVITYTTHLTFISFSLVSISTLYTN